MKCIVVDTTLSSDGEKRYFEKRVKDITGCLATVYTLDKNKAFVFTSKSDARSFIKEQGGTLEEV